MAETASTLSDISGIAASTMNRAAWDRAYHEYQRLSLMRDAYSDIGPLARTNAQWDEAKEKIAREFGASDCTAARKARKKAWLDVEDRLACEQTEFGLYCDNATVAMLDLMRTPSPDIAAAQTKIDICENVFCEDDRHQLEIWQAIDADLRRMVREKP